ncbi:hypothetical protein MTO96_025764 [Rhipicephalus appendiculatus]
MQRTNEMPGTRGALCFSMHGYRLSWGVEIPPDRGMEKKPAGREPAMLVDSAVSRVCIRQCSRRHLCSTNLAPGSEREDKGRLARSLPRWSQYSSRQGKQRSSPCPAARKPLGCPS